MPDALPIFRLLTLLAVISCISPGCQSNVKDKIQESQHNYANPDSLLAEFTESPQQFRISSKETSIVKGKHGTRIHVNPDDLETIDGSPLDDEIHIELLELTRKSELIFHNVQTVSGEVLLESGGVYYIGMTANDKMLKLKDGRKLLLELPKISNNEMSLFNGKRDSLGQMQWEPSDAALQSSTRIDTIFSPVVDTLGNILRQDTVLKDFVTRYLTESDRLGWINVDRIVKNNSPVRTLTLESENSTLQIIKYFVILQDRNSFIASAPTNKHITRFESIPQQEALLIIGIASDEKTLFYFEQPLVLSNDERLKADFNPSSVEFIHQRMSNL